MKSNNSNRREIRSAIKTVIEQLEKRQYFASSLSASGDLSILGTEGDEVISIGRTGTQYRATVGSISEFFNASDVNSIAIDGLGGNNNVVVSSALLSGISITGGNGANDTLTVLGTTSQDDVVFGLTDSNGNLTESSVINLSENGISVTFGGFEHYAFDGKGGFDNLTVNSPVNLTLNGSQQFQSLTLHGTSAVEMLSGPAMMVLTREFHLGSQSSLDLNSNLFVWDYSDTPDETPYSALLDDVKDGLTLLGGSGTHGIRSSVVDNQSVQATLLAVVDNGHPLIDGQITSVGTFTGIPEKSVIIGYTWFGDSNIDGQVDSSDYALADTGFTSGGTLGGWVFGDIDYSGNVDGGDYALVDTGFISFINTGIGIYNPTPTNVFVQNLWNGAARISWTSPSSEVVEYLVFASKDGGLFQQVGDTTDTHFDFRSPSVGNYEFRVSAVYQATSDPAVNAISISHPRQAAIFPRATTYELNLGIDSGADHPGYQYPSPPSPSEPNAPWHLNAVASTATQAITLTWTDNSDNESGFKVYRSDDNGVNYSVITTVGANATSYTDHTVTGGKYYTYFVVSTNSNVNSYPSNPIQSVARLYKPTALTASNADWNSIDLHWTDSNSYETGYVIEMLDSSTSAWQSLATTSPGSTDFTVNGLDPSTQYQFRIKAIGAYESLYTTSSSITTLSEPSSPLAAPSDISVDPDSDSSRTIVWTDNNNAETKYLLQAQYDESGWSDLVTTAVGATSYTMTNVQEGHQLRVRIRAVSTDGTQKSLYAFSEAVEIPLKAPTGASVAATSSTSVSFSWTNNSSAQSGFDISWQSEDGNDSGVASVDSNIASYAVTGLKPTITYLFSVKATGSVDSDWVTSSNITLDGVATPTNVHAEVFASSTAEAQVTWSAPSSQSVDQYNIYAKLNDEDYQLFASVDGSVTSYRFYSQFDGDVKFKVESFLNGIASDAIVASQSGSETVLALSPAVTNIAYTATSPTSVQLTWQDHVATETGYLIRYATVTSSGGVSAPTSVLIDPVSGNTGSYTITGLDPVQTYIVAVLPVNDLVAANTVFDKEGVNSIHASTQTNLAPTNLIADAITTSSIKLTWVGTTSDPADYTVYTSTTGGTTWPTSHDIHTTTSNGEFVISDLSADTAYTFKVVRKFTSANSKSSMLVQAKTLKSGGESLSFNTPTGITIGQVVHLFGYGGNVSDSEGPVTYIWHVNHNGFHYAGGEGTTFNFIPSTIGIYTISLSTINTDVTGPDDEPITIELTSTLTVTDASIPIAIVDGPTVSQVGDISTYDLVPGSDMDFGPTVAAPQSYSDSVIFNWTAADSIGKIVASEHASLSNSAFNFLPPSPGDYRIDLQIVRTDGTVGYQGTLKTTALAVDADPESLIPTINWYGQSVQAVPGNFLVTIDTSTATNEPISLATRAEAVTDQVATELSSQFSQNFSDAVALTSAVGEVGTFSMNVPANIDATAVATLLSSISGVTNVVPNLIGSIESISPSLASASVPVPFDSTYGTWWRTQINLKTAQDITKGSSSIVTALIDAGVDISSRLKGTLEVDASYNQSLNGAAFNNLIGNVKAGSILNPSLFRNLHDNDFNGANNDNLGINKNEGNKLTDAFNVTLSTQTNPTNSAATTINFTDDAVGWDFASGTDATPTLSSGDNNPMSVRNKTHGTAVASILVGNNTYGFASYGVASGTKFLPLKVSTSWGGKTNAWVTLAATVNALKYVNMMYDFGYNIRINTGAWAFSGKNAIGLDDTINPLYKTLALARDRGILIISAAQNDGTKLDKQDANGKYIHLSYPSAYTFAHTESTTEKITTSDILDNIIIVGATVRGVDNKNSGQSGKETLASGDDLEFDPNKGPDFVSNPDIVVNNNQLTSNYGPKAVQIAAPGFLIQTLEKQAPGTIGTGNKEQFGTSLAMPMVAGTAALLLSLKPNLSIAELRYYILDQATQVPTLGSFIQLGRRLDVGKSVKLLKEQMPYDDKYTFLGDAGGNPTDDVFTITLNSDKKIVVAGKNGTAIGNPIDNVSGTRIGIFGLFGNDRIIVSNDLGKPIYARFYIDGGAGNDYIVGGSGNDTLVGNAGNDVIHGMVGGDLIDGSSGNDKLYGEAGQDSIAGGKGEDRLYSAGDTVLTKRDGAKDRLDGGVGNDYGAWDNLDQDIVAKDSSDNFTIENAIVLS